MKKKYACFIDCANCADKVERAIKKVDGVQDAKVNFMTQKFTLVADEDQFDQILEQAIKAGKHAESDFEVTLK
ncbi:MAG: cation transporter [Eubacteriales bacterium]|nr:cation transporter [Eubacteriales bacterium]